MEDTRELKINKKQSLIVDISKSIKGNIEVKITLKWVKYNNVLTYTYYSSLVASQVALVLTNPPASAGDIRDQGLIPGLERSPAGGNSNPFQYSCLENPMDRGGLWLETVHSIAKSRTSDLAHTDALGQLTYDSESMYFWVKIYVTESYREKVLWVICRSSVVQSCLTLQLHVLQLARLPCPSPAPRACSNSLLQQCIPGNNLLRRIMQIVESSLLHQQA